MYARGRFSVEFKMSGRVSKAFFPGDDLRVIRDQGKQRRELVFIEAIHIWDTQYSQIKMMETYPNEAFLTAEKRPGLPEMSETKKLFSLCLEQGIGRE